MLLGRCTATGLQVFCPCLLSNSWELERSFPWGFVLFKLASVNHFFISFILTRHGNRLDVFACWWCYSCRPCRENSAPANPRGPAPMEVLLTERYQVRQQSGSSICGLPVVAAWSVFDYIGYRTSGTCIWTSQWHVMWIAFPFHSRLGSTFFKSSVQCTWTSVRQSMM